MYYTTHINICQLLFSHTAVFFQSSGKEYITHLRLSFIFFLETVHTLNTFFLYTVSQIVDLHTHYLPPHKKRKTPDSPSGVFLFYFIFPISLLWFIV